MATVDGAADPPKCPMDVTGLFTYAQASHITHTVCPSAQGEQICHLPTESGQDGDCRDKVTY